MLLWLSTLFIFPFLQSVLAQSGASCLPFYNWTSNSENQTPCEVASSLLAVCNGGPFPVQPLPVMTHYQGPSLQNANACQCNTVTYSLMSACGACQGRTYISWSEWSANCAMVYVDTYPEPIPLAVSVPGWAYLDVEAIDNFDQSNARKNANLTESTAIPSPTSSTTSSVTSTNVPLTTTHTSMTNISLTPTPASTTSTTTTASTTASTGTSGPSMAHGNAVGGGVVGGLGGLVIVIGLLWWYIQRRKRILNNGVHLTSPTESENPSWHGGQGPYMSQVPAPQTPVLPSASFVGDQAAYHSDTSVSGSADSVPVGPARV